MLYSILAYCLENIKLYEKTIYNIKGRKHSGSQPLKLSFTCLAISIPEMVSIITFFSAVLVTAKIFCIKLQL